MEAGFTVTLKRIQGSFKLAPQQDPFLETFVKFHTVSAWEERSTLIVVEEHGVQV